MSDMLTYIFSSLRSSEKRLDAVAKELVKQRSFNAKVTIFVAMVILDDWLDYKERRDQSARIRKLEKEIEELKQPEGE